MAGIVLLDDDQQRALAHPDSTRGIDRHAPSFATSRHRQTSDAQTTISNASTDHRGFATLGGERGDRGGGSAGKPSTATLGYSPRTDFTTRIDARTRRVPPSIDVASFQDEATVTDPWMYDDGPHESLDGSARGKKEREDLSMKLILAGVGVGIVLGIILKAVDTSPLVARWVMFPCELLLRALWCVIVPYVFCSVAVAIGDIVYVGKISVVGFQTAKIFVFFWIATSVLGMGVALLFRPLFHYDPPTAFVKVNAIGFNCANHEPMTMLANGSLACSPPSANATVGALATATGLPSDAMFMVIDVNRIFAAKSGGPVTDLSLGELLRTLILNVVTPNLPNSFIKSELLSIIVAAMVLGSIAGRNYFNKTRRVNYLYLTLMQLRDALFLMMEWLIALLPIGIVSFIGSFMATNVSAMNATHAYYYVLAAFCAAVLQMFVVLPAIVFFMTQCNPYNHMKQMVRAYVFALACSSSIATTPVSISCIKRARVCSQSLSNFVISIGVCSNTSAAGFYLPIAVLFLAESAGSDTEITVVRLFGLFAMSLVSCFGTPPVPAGGLVMVMVVYSALFGVTEMPPGFVYVLSLDFIVDRLATVCNVNDDLMAVKIIAEITDETVVQEHLGERS